MNFSHTLYLNKFYFFKNFLEFEKNQLTKRTSVYFAFKKKKQKTTYFTKKLSKFKTKFSLTQGSLKSIFILYFSSLCITLLQNNSITKNI